jgi:hypothetical protein
VFEHALIGAVTDQGVIVLWGLSELIDYKAP